MTRSPTRLTVRCCQRCQPRLAVRPSVLLDPEAVHRLRSLSLASALTYRRYQGLPPCRHLRPLRPLGLCASPQALPEGLHGRAASHGNCRWQPRDTNPCQSTRQQLQTGGHALLHARTRAHESHLKGQALAEAARRCGSASCHCHCQSQHCRIARLGGLLSSRAMCRQRLRRQAAASGQC